MAGSLPNSSIWAQPDPNAVPMALASMPSTSTVEDAPPAIAPAFAAHTPTPVETNLAHDQAKLQKVQWAQDHPWGTPENHPGTLGKLAHVFSTIGNIAGNVVAPNVMANIPQTQMGMKFDEARLNNRVEGEEKEKSAEEEATAREGLQGAQQGEAEERTAEMPENQEIAKEEADAKSQPSLANAYAHAVQQAIKNGQDPAIDPIVQHLSDAIVALQPGQNKPETAAKTTDIQQPDGKVHTMGWDEKTGKYDVDEGISGFKPAVTRIDAGLGRERFDNEQKQQALKTFTPALDSAERFNVMSESYEKAVRNHDQQAMLNLLANHLGMTMGLQKGSRITRDLYQEAAQSTPWLQKVGAKFDSNGYLSGVTLNPTQMRQMVDLARSRYSQDLSKARNEGRYLGIQDDGPQRDPTPATINYYIGLAGGDAAKAKQLAQQDGWSVK